MNTTLIMSFGIAVVFFVLVNVFFDVKFFNGILDAILKRFGNVLDGIGKYNTEKYIERRKKQRIIKPKEGIVSKYNNLVEGLISDLQLPLSLESFTTLLCIGFAIVVLVIVLFMKNVTLSVVIAVSVFIGLFTAFVMASKSVSAEKMESIMDAEDIICPLAKEGVLNAIKKVMENEDYIKDNIRPYFKQFVSNCEDNGYSFRQAITLLNKQLGHKFDNFANMKWNTMQPNTATRSAAVPMILRNSGSWLSAFGPPSSFPRARKDICLQPLRAFAAIIRLRNCRTRFTLWAEAKPQTSTSWRRC